MGSTIMKIVFLSTVPLPVTREDCSDLRLLSSGTAQTTPSPYQLDVEMFREVELVSDLPVMYSYMPNRTYNSEFS